ncbi:T9SS type A sorting domain-containing protein [candidate division WOR-3 bacterium]|nr:T9SS type A sorting domain-containing protein [candidate division WOR-3 bacterium]
MKKTFLLLTLWVLSAGVIFCQNVNGDTTRVDRNMLVLRIWGTHQERGFAYGYLLAPRIGDVFENYVLSYIFYNNASLYESARSFYVGNFSVSQDYLAEAGAMIDGVVAAGESTWCAVLNRDLDSMDILMASAMDEIVEALECSSLSSWGPMTQNDTILNGSLVITRMMDWTSNSTLKDNHLIIVSIPSESDEQPWVSVAYSGFIAALSAVNDSGLTSFKNMGNSPDHPNPTDLYPALIASRDAVESRDLNSDGKCDVFDAVSAFSSHRFYCSSIIQATCSRNDTFAAIAIECDNQHGDTFRVYSHDGSIPLYNVVCTNHFRALQTPVYCYRYNNITDSIRADSSVTPERSWKIMSGGAGVSSNNQMIQWIGQTRTLKISAATSDSPAYLRTPVSLNIDSLFNETFVEEPVDREVDFPRDLKVNFYLNPPYFEIHYQGQDLASLAYSLFDASGRVFIARKHLEDGFSGRISLSDMPPGVYFLNIEGERIGFSGQIFLMTKKIFSFR